MKKFEKFEIDEMGGATREDMVGTLKDVDQLWLTSVDVEDEGQFKKCLQAVQIAGNPEDNNHVSILDLRQNYFYGKGTLQRVIDIFKNVTANITQIIMPDVKFAKDRNPDEILQIFQAFPKNVTQVNMGRNDLFNAGHRLVDCIKELNPDMEELDLSSNFLNRLCPEHFIELCEAIGTHFKNLKKLHLNDNGLFNLKAEEEDNAVGIQNLQKALSKLPKSLTELSLRGNSLHKMDLQIGHMDELNRIFKEELALEKVDMDGNFLQEHHKQMMCDLSKLAVLQYQ